MQPELIQGTTEWLAARCGSLGASSISDALARTKSGWGAGRANVMARLICERLTGLPQDSFTNAAMQWGTATEPQARATYELVMGVDVVEDGLRFHPEITGTHASPDGLVGDDGMIECKCPNTATHIDTLLAQKIPGKYVQQMQWQMACYERQWVDFVSFDPRLPADLQFWCKRVDRDGKVIEQMESDVREFLADLDAKLAALENVRASA